VPGGAAIAPEAAPGATPAPAAPGAATHNGSLLSDSGDPSPWPVWAWACVCSAVALALGFLLGWRTLDRRIRRKYGGLKIY
jgi:membrane protein DedA with SNARE-associated domain